MSTMKINLAGKNEKNITLIIDSFNIVGIS